MGRSLLVALLITLPACRVESGARADSVAVRLSGVAARVSATPVATTWNAGAWRPPSVAALPDDSAGASIRRGLAILTHTPDSLPGYAGGNLSCASCHLDAGTRPGAAPIAGAAARFPKFMDRSAVVATIQDRVNYCFTRSLAGRRLPDDSREMHDLVAYIAFVSTGVPQGEHVRGEGMARMPALHGDSTRGAALYAATCARCHGGDGAGGTLGATRVPALWGARSFSVGASMAREERAASFVRHNMPYDRPGSLTDQQAFDVAAYVTSLPRPDSPAKEHDWPTGGAPYDVPYDTRGHAAFRRPTLIPRADTAGAVVGAPRAAARSR